MFDLSSNTRILTSDSGAQTAEWLCDAFGRELYANGDVGALRFGGEFGYWSDSIDRVYVRARHYDPTSGRWISRDPIGFDGDDWNLRRYGWNRPTAVIDPSGNVGRIWTVVIVLIVIVVVVSLGCGKTKTTTKTTKTKTKTFVPAPCNGAAVGSLGKSLGQGTEDCCITHCSINTCPTASINNCENGCNNHLHGND